MAAIEQAQLPARVSTHSRPKAADDAADLVHKTAIVSTHSRPKAADAKWSLSIWPICCFNTQPPEGG